MRRTTEVPRSDRRKVRNEQKVQCENVNHLILNFTFHDHKVQRSIPLIALYKTQLSECKQFNSKLQFGNSVVSMFENSGAQIRNQRAGA
jgi:hypothetical protein